MTSVKKVIFGNPIVWSACHEEIVDSDGTCLDH